MSIVSYLSRRGLRDGVLGGRRPWLVVGAVVWAVKFLRRISARRPEVVGRETLKSGDRVMVSSVERSKR